MNPDQPSRELIEARITALLLGELPSAEAELLRWTISQDAELQKLHDRLKLTIGFVREAVKPPADAPAPKEGLLKLPPERRQKLLDHFKTPRPRQPFLLRQFKVRPLVTALAAVAAIAVLAALFLPALAASKRRAQSLAGANSWSAEPIIKSLSEKQSGSPSLHRPIRMKGGPPPPSPVVAPPVASAPAIEAPPAGIVLPETGSSPANGSDFAVKNVGFGEGQNNSSALVTTLPEGIVLPQPAASPPGGVYSQGTLGYVNAPNNPGAPLTTSADSLSVGNGIVINGFAAGGGGGGGGGGNTFTPNDTMFAWDAAGANRLRANEQPSPSGAPALSYYLGGGKAFGGVGSQSSARGKLPLEPLDHGVLAAGIESQTSATNPGAELPSVNAPETTLSVSGVPAGGTRRDLSKTDGDALGLSRNNSSAGGVAVNDRTPTLKNGFVGGTLADAVAADRKTAKDKSRGQKETALEVVSTATLASAKPQPSSPAILHSPALQLQERAKTTPPEFAITNAIQVRQQAEAEGSLAYVQAKQRLDELQQFHSLLASKIESAKLDLKIPQSSMVEITTPAEPGQSQNAWQKVTGEVESKTRIRIEPDSAGEIAGLAGSSTSGSAATVYDPHFIQTEFEVIQSDAVLGKAVEALKLDEAWAKNGGEKLNKEDAIRQLKRRLDLKPVPYSKLVEIGARSDKPEEAAKLANAVAEAYKDYRVETRRQLALTGISTLEAQLNQQQEEVRVAQAEVDRLAKESKVEQADQPLPKPSPAAPVPQPEIQTRDNAFSTFSLNVSDVSFKLAAASLEKGRMPDAASIRTEEFINAFDYRDPEAAAGQPLAFAAERARYPFAHNRELLRFSVKAAAAGRPAGRALNLVLLLDTSGSMERADRVAIIREALRVLATQLQPQDTVSVVTFARTARLWADGVSGDKAGETLEKVGGITPEGGTNLEEAMRLAYETARRHYLVNGKNRVVVLTDGAANLGNVDPVALKQTVEANRKQGIALDCFGIGWEDYNDDLLEQLASNGDGRYAFINSPDAAPREFAAKLAGALQVAAQDVKVQVEFNPQRVISWRQIGYAKHQLTKEQFRDNTVDAGEIAAREAGNALYTIETNPNDVGPIATVRVRYRAPGTQDYRERNWDVPYTGDAPALERASAAMRLAATAGAFSEWLAANPFAGDVTPDQLLGYLSGVPQTYGADARPATLEWMIRQAKSLSGK
ncbi:MAG TPA: von Willebrand factor type A domain-containing protein [Candidatus Acidoferrum sp.]|nr:von Willebrand factor type A domain-containing protein [Candidatus Acidoferrum sp.]